MKLKDILTKRELKKVKEYIKKEIDKGVYSTYTGYKVNALKDYYKDLENLDENSFGNIRAFIGDKKIREKIEKHI